MIPEVAAYLDKARECLANARKISAIGIPSDAARDAYMAGFHSAQAFIFATTGKAAKTHSGVRTEFARLAKADTRIDKSLPAFLGKAYELKSIADYGISPNIRVSAGDAVSAIETAAMFIERVDQLLK
ncbi:MAG: HEPN domain-containing protein [Alphaproteobacteria bacterium]